MTSLEWEIGKAVGRRGEGGRKREGRHEGRREGEGEGGKEVEGEGGRSTTMNFNVESAHLQILREGSVTSSEEFINEFLGPCDSPS